MNVCYSIQFIHSQNCLWKRQCLPSHEPHRTSPHRKFMKLEILSPSSHVNRRGSLSTNISISVFSLNWSAFYQNALQFSIVKCTSWSSFSCIPGLPGWLFWGQIPEIWPFLKWFGMKNDVWHVRQSLELFWWCWHEKALFGIFWNLWLSYCSRLGIVSLFLRSKVLSFLPRSHPPRYKHRSQIGDITGRETQYFFGQDFENYGTLYSVLSGKLCCIGKINKSLCKSG